MLGRFLLFSYHNSRTRYYGVFCLAAAAAAAVHADPSNRNPADATYLVTVSSHGDMPAGLSGGRVLPRTRALRSRRCFDDVTASYTGESLRAVFCKTRFWASLLFSSGRGMDDVTLSWRRHKTPRPAPQTVDDIHL